MAMNRIQFQPGMSLFEFFERYSSESQREAALEQSRLPSPDLVDCRHAV
jgi:hypothetical protein